LPGAQDRSSPINSSSTAKIASIFRRLFGSSSQLSAVAMADVQKTVDELIRDHSVMIFSKRECSHCEKTKKLFLKKHIQTYVMELDEKGKTPMAFSRT